MLVLILGLIGSWVLIVMDSPWPLTLADSQAVVARVAVLLPTPDGRATFLLPEDGRLEGMRRLDPKKPEDSQYISRFYERRLVGAERHADGRLTVTLVTRSRGHAGVWGLYYSNPPCSQAEAAMAFGAGTASRVDAHWWEVEDRSQ